MARAETVSFEEFQSSEPPQRRKRHPLRNTIVTLVVLVVLAVAAYLVAEPLAEQFAGEAVKVAVAKELGANQDDVHVDLGSGSIILQLINRRVNHIDVDIDRFSSGALTGSAVFAASGVPLDSNKPVSKVAITASLDADALHSLLTSGAAAAATPTTVAFAGKDVRIGTTLTILGAAVATSVDLAPSVANGQLVLTPAAITIGTAHFTVAQLQASPLGGLVSGLAAPRTMCVASSLPNNLDLKSVSVRGKHLLVGVGGSNLTLSSLAHKGTCPAG
jgi:hypothetical protein